MNKNSIFAGLLAIALTFTFSCKKKSNDPAPSRTSLLTAKGWKLSSYKIQGVDITSQSYDACKLDDIYTYKADGTYSKPDGGTKCSPADDETGTWKFLNGDAQFVQNTDTFNVDQLSSSSFTYSQTDSGVKESFTLNAQ